MHSPSYLVYTAQAIYVLGDFLMHILYLIVCNIYCYVLGCDFCMPQQLNQHSEGHGYGILINLLMCEERWFSSLSNWKIETSTPAIALRLYRCLVYLHLISFKVASSFVNSQHEIVFSCLPNTQILVELEHFFPTGYLCHKKHTRFKYLFFFISLDFKFFFEFVNQFPY